MNPSNKPMVGDEHFIIGQMSGTSLDGIDLIYVRIGFEEYYHFEILAAETIPYSEVWLEKLKNGFYLHGEALKKLDVEYGYLLAEVIQDFIKSHLIEKVDYIASHGHTIFHKPEEHYTLQIGNGPQISEKTRLKTICNFRVQDVALGGQGAPLVPIGDRWLFSNYDYCLNLGGFANISLEHAQERIAFDICSVNIVLNHYSKKMGLPFDNQGITASSGTLNEALFLKLNDLGYYSKSHPKSLGYEYVAATVIPLIDAYNLPIKDILRTFVEHSAFQIAGVLNTYKKKNCLISGGGAFNIFLIERIKAHTAVELVIPEKMIVNYKEALIFAFLGYLKNKDEVNCLKSVTGARKNHSSGVIFYST